MRRKAIIAIAIMAALLGLAGCAGAGSSANASASANASSGGLASTTAGSGESGQAIEVTGSPATKDGVTVTIESASFSPATNPPHNKCAFEVAIENNSSQPVMRIAYSITVLDADGNEIRTFGGDYDGETQALAPGETVTETRDDLRVGEQYQPAAAVLEISQVTPESELPAIHLPQTGEPLYTSLNDDKLANMEAEPPVELAFHIDQGGYGRTATFAQGADLDRAASLLRDIVIGPETGEWVTDNYNWIALTWADGSSTFISLNLNTLEYAGHPGRYHMYALENLEPFWSFAAAHVTDDPAGAGHQGDDA